MYAEESGLLHDKLDHIQAEEAHLREDINAKHHVTAPPSLDSTTSDHPNKMKSTILGTAATKKPVRQKTSFSCAQSIQQLNATSCQ